MIKTYSPSIDYKIRKEKDHLRIFFPNIVFLDGDSPTLIIIPKNNKLIVSDEGRTFVRYGDNERINNILKDNPDIVEEDGALTMQSYFIENSSMEKLFTKFISILLDIDLEFRQEKYEKSI